MRKHLRLSALALVGAMSVAVSARPAAAVVESEGPYCTIMCTATAAGCAALGSSSEFCAGMFVGCMYGCKL